MLQAKIRNYLYVETSSTINRYPESFQIYTGYVVFTRKSPVEYQTLTISRKLLDIMIEMITTPSLTELPSLIDEKPPYSQVFILNDYSSI
jgi:hypothetical protein